ncbi:PREDICTED: putative fatty acyl-CoA reductase CG5065 [Dufourea novaeangliae]|uniref:putative fatty acyl-CoA reductase CG5065 n=1 Tax=Dufourea novaeangliae TaxID=178035 RepID=UPI000767C822|nr:PREDICTED: putative fatty acyl-CoA reductase CG5065 [Dufourea novaeangliae]
MTLREWYANREVFLTGVTSNVGRTLIEKILYSFPEAKVYVMLRSRSGFNKEDRIKQIFLSPGFERLRQIDPNAISRVKVLEGNLLYDGLGLSKEDKNLLQNVSVAFHAAGPHDGMFEFCQELPRLEVMVAISCIFRHKGRITESLQNERVPNGSVALVRVPLVGPSLREPMPGFVDVLKGPTAFMVGAGLALGNSEFQAEIIPIDLTVNTLIAVAWERATAKDVQGTVVYNAVSLDCTWNELIKKGSQGNRKFTYPTFGFRGMTSSAALHWILVMLFEWLPSVLCDTILGLCGAKKRLLQEHRKVRNALRSLESISWRSWSAERNHVYQLQQRLTPEDQDAFPVATEIDIESYVLCAAAAARKHCVDEANISLVKIFRLLFFFLVGTAILYSLFLSSFHVIPRHDEPPCFLFRRSCNDGPEEIESSPTRLISQLQWNSQPIRCSAAFGNRTPLYFARK